uniref:Uncharacterized protein n=1 Tax=Eutreptiella gymnastica TaxID=73025 RepID=A0A7S1IX58_9EUGL|mmetsp:Transcript_48690/g.86641  ORF Transcript_48690/g.86641 Transcript_48690/m.86641 type:complete len:165 (+) Transcript_48690:91-585(+)
MHRISMTHHQSMRGRNQAALVGSKGEGGFRTFFKARLPPTDSCPTNAEFFATKGSPVLWVHMVPQTPQEPFFLRRKANTHPKAIRDNIRSATNGPQELCFVQLVQCTPNTKEPYTLSGGPLPSGSVSVSTTLPHPRCVLHFISSGERNGMGSSTLYAPAVQVHR